MLAMVATEKAWFADSAGEIIGAILFDRSDKDWNYVILGPDDVGDFRWIGGGTSFKDRQTAETAILAAMSEIEKTGKATEELIRADPSATCAEETRILFRDMNDELKRYFAQHPEKLYDLSPRKFEELIASIMGDFGFDVELTPASRDGGRDIIAYLRNAVCAYLT